MNRVILIGRLTRDPELRTTTGGLAVASFGLAVSRTIKNKDGNYDTDFFNVSVFGRGAANVSKYCTKGSQVGVDGRVQIRQYDAQDGSKRIAVDIIAERVEFLGSKRDVNMDYSPNSYVDQIPDAPIDVVTDNEIEVPEGDPYKDFGNEIVVTDDDLPF